MPARTTALRCRWSNSSRSCGHQLSMNVGKYAREFFHSPDTLGTLRPEYLWKWVDACRSDADVVHGDAGVVGFLDRVCGVGPRVTALVTLVRDQAVADDDQQAPFGGLRKESAGQVSKRCTKPGVSACGKAQLARRREPAVLEVLEAPDLHPMPGVASEHEHAVSF